MSNEETALKDAILRVANELRDAAGAAAVRVYGRELDVVAAAGKLGKPDEAVVLGAVRRGQRSAAHLLAGGVISLDLGGGKIVVAAAARRLYLAVVTGRIGDGDGEFSETQADELVAAAQAALHQLILGGPAGWGGIGGGGGGPAVGPKKSSA